MQYTKFHHKGSDCYSDQWYYCTVWVDHTKGEYITLVNKKHPMSLHTFHRYIIEMLGIEGYHDATCEDFLCRTSDKKLKAQGLKNTLDAS